MMEESARNSGIGTEMDRKRRGNAPERALRRVNMALASAPKRSNFLIERNLAEPSSFSEVPIGTSAIPDCQKESCRAI